MVYYIKTQKTLTKLLTLMTHITLDQMSNYLNSGATLDDVRSMIEMLQGYQEEIVSSIADWQDLIPTHPEDGKTFQPGVTPYHWGDRARRKNLKAIGTWLMRLGYAVRWPRLSDDLDTSIWEVVRNEQVGRLHWECDRYFIEGIAKPAESDNDADRFPECLSCWE